MADPVKGVFPINKTNQMIMLRASVVAFFGLALYWYSAKSTTAPEPIETHSAESTKSPEVGSELTPTTTTHESEVEGLDGRITVQLVCFDHRSGESARPFGYYDKSKLTVRPWHDLYMDAVMGKKLDPAKSRDGRFGIIMGQPEHLYLARIENVGVTADGLPTWQLASKPQLIERWHPGDNPGQTLKSLFRGY